MTKFLPLFFLLTFSILSSVHCGNHLITNSHKTITFKVLDFGAVGDGSTDDTQAFHDAWEATCKSKAHSPTMRVPSKHNFLVQPIVFKGPCKSRVKVEIDGNLTAPSRPSKWNCTKKKCSQWIAFYEVDGLHISGSGTMDGQGTKWWNSYCKKNQKHCKKPTGFVIENSNNVHMNGITLKDSPQMQIAIERSTWVYVNSLTVKAPGNSPNTDGFHLQHSQHVFIDQSHIGTGDDCVSIGDGSSHINISNVICGPGHGISIGSLGKHGKHETVENVHVRDVEFSGTSNGVRIKTWQGGSGYARNIIFEHITCHGPERPIIIDQYYCDHETCTNHTSAVHVSNVRYSHIHGTSSSETVVEFACSKTVPCTDIYMNDVVIHTTRHRTQTSSFCSNVKGRQDGEIFPHVPCLT